MLSNKEFEALAMYYNANQYKHNWLQGDTVLGGSFNEALERVGWIIREVSDEKAYYRITDNGIKAYWNQKYHYAKDTVYQIRRLAKFSISNCKTIDDFKQKLELILMVTSGQIEWTDDNRVLPYSEKPKEEMSDETEQLFEPYAKAAFTKAIGILDAPKVKWDDLPDNPKQAWIEAVKEVFYMLNVQNAETGEFYVERPEPETKQ